MLMGGSLFMGTKLEPWVDWFPSNFKHLCLPVCMYKGVEAKSISPTVCEVCDIYTWVPEIYEPK